LAAAAFAPLASSAIATQNVSMAMTAPILRAKVEIPVAVQGAPVGR
jgi:hypothetical protein